MKDAGLHPENRSNAEYRVHKIPQYFEYTVWNTYTEECQKKSLCWPIKWSFNGDPTQTLISCHDYPSTFQHFLTYRHGLSAIRRMDGSNKTSVRQFIFCRWWQVMEAWQRWFICGHSLGYRPSTSSAYLIAAVYLLCDNPNRKWAAVRLQTRKIWQQALSRN